MPPKYNNDEFIQLVLGIAFGVIAIILVWVVIKTGDFAFLINSSVGNHSKSGLRGIPVILFIILGIVGLYYSLKKLFTTKKKNDT